jgi:hypothetical protein
MVVSLRFSSSTFWGSRCVFSVCNGIWSSHSRLYAPSLYDHHEQGAVHGPHHGSWVGALSTPSCRFPCCCHSHSVDPMFLRHSTVISPRSSNSPALTLSTWSS